MWRNILILSSVLALTFGANAEGRKTLSPQADFYDQFDKCTARVLKHSIPNLPSGEVVLKFELQKGGRAVNFSIDPRQKGYNEKLAKHFLERISKCNRYRTSITGEISIPIKHTRAQ